LVGATIYGSAARPGVFTADEHRYEDLTPCVGKSTRKLSLRRYVGYETGDHFRRLIGIRQGKDAG
jgi:hypothetical protein